MSGRLLHVSARWFRLLLRLYPVDFREDVGDAVVEAYADRAREAVERGGVPRLARVWISALVDSVRNGLAERVRPAVSWKRSGNWGRDMELVGRRLRKQPLFVAAVVGTLTVGLGTFAVVYTAADKILIEPLPYRYPNDLYKVWTDIPRIDVRGGTVSGPQVVEIQRAGGVIEDAAGVVCGNGAIPATDGRDAYHINMMVASGNLFDLLGARPALGRGFRPAEGGLGRPTAIVLSDGMWRRLGANPGILGTPLRIGPDTHTVVGVMAPDFTFACSATQTPDVYVPFTVDLAKQPPTNYPFQTLIRARRGASPEAVAQSLDRAAQTIVERVPSSRGLGLYAVGVHADLVEDIRPALLALNFAAVFLLLVLTVNLASLLLARAAEREREFAVSRALGARRSAVLRATLLEGGLLGLIGGVAGVLVGVWATRLLVALGPSDLPRRDNIVLDSAIAATVVAGGVLLGFLAAAVPAAWAARVSSASLMSARPAGAGSSTRMRRSLIVAQIALSLVLLSAGGLVVRSFERLLTADPGFNAEGVLTLRLSTIVFPENAEAASFLDRAADALRALPGVAGVTTTTSLPLSGAPANTTTISFPVAPGNTGDPDEDRPLVEMVRVRAGYVETMGMRLRAGRSFEPARTAGVREALIDRHLAGQFFPDSSPLGATLQWDDITITVIGVVDQARLHDLHQDGRPQVFLRAEDYGSRGYWFFAIRARSDPRDLIPHARAVIRDIERRIPVSQMFTMEEIVAEARSREGVSAALIAGLGLGALLLVAMGLFGVISGSVTRRRRELAVRLALGATPRRVVRLVIGEGALLVTLGVLFGVPGVYAAGGLVRGLLIDLSPWDPPTLLGVTLTLMLVTMTACYVPARRVLRLDPAPLLRQD
jgi:putative ABC transport system permease protein